MDHLVVVCRRSVGRIEHLPDAVEERYRLGTMLLQVQGRRLVSVVMTLVLLVQMPVVVAVIVLATHGCSVTAQRGISGARIAASCSRCGEPRYSFSASGSSRCSSTDPPRRT